MARVDEKGPINPGISSRVDAQLVNPNTVGTALKTQSEVAGEASKIFLEINRRQVENKNSDFAFNSVVDDSKKLGEFEIKDIQENGYDGHAERAKQFSQDIQDERAKNAPSEGALKLYQQHGATQLVHFGLTAQKNEVIGANKQSKETLTTLSNESAKTQLQNPNAAYVPEQLRLFNDALDLKARAGTVPLDEVDNFKRDHARLLTHSMYDGFLDKGDAGLDEGLRQLKNPEMVKNLTADDLDRLNNSFNARVKSRDTLNLQTARSKMQDYMADIENGNTVDYKGLASTLGTISKNPQAEKDEVQRMQNTIRAVTVVGKSIEKLKNSPNTNWGAEIQKTIEGIRGKDKTFGAKEEVAVQSAYQRQIEKLRSAQKEDAYSYVNTVNSELNNAQKKIPLGPLPQNIDPREVQAAVDKNVSLQAQLGIKPDERRVGSKQEAQAWSELIATAKNPDQASYYLEQMHIKYGDKTPAFMRDVIEEDKNLAGMELSGYFTSRQAKASIASNVLQKKQISEAFKDPKYSSESKDLAQAVSDKMDDIKLSMTMGSNSTKRIEMGNNFQEVLETEVKKRRLNGDTRRLGNLVDDSYDRLIGSQFDVVDQGRSRVLVNKSAYKDASPEDVKQFIDTFSTKKGFEELDVRQPPQIEQAWKQRFNEAYGQQGGDKRARDNWMSVLENNHRWVANDHNDGIYLVYDDGINPPVALIDGKGALIEKPLSSLRSDKTVFTKKVNTLEQKRRDKGMNDYLSQRF